MRIKTIIHILKKRYVRNKQISKILEINMRIIEIMKIIEVHMRIKKIMNILETN